MEQAKLPWSRHPKVDHDKAMQLASYLAGHEGVSDAAIYNAACVFSLASLDKGASAAERARRASQSLVYLTGIASRDYFRDLRKLKELHSDVDLDPLRSRPDFKKIVDGLRPSG
jgi:hypothetical protein